MRCYRLITVLLTGFWLVAISCFAAEDALPDISANDNRVPAGRLEAGVLTLHLELRKGLWRPEAPDGRDQAASVETPRAFDVYSFAEEGHQPQMPGPLLRVSQGTELHVSVHNLLHVAVVVYGLEQHPGNGKNVLKIAPGERKEARFAAGEPGSYIYTATSAGGPSGADEPPASGAFIVDAPGASTADRIFVIQGLVRNAFHRSFEMALAINGKSWPYTERLHATLGHPEHWRVLNAGGATHPMHLHGFYFHVDAVGDGESEQHFAEAERPMVVTETVLSFHTFDMTWTPDRPGNWLFHCHILEHMMNYSQPWEYGPEGPPPAAEHAHHGYDASGMGMAGLVLGI